MSGNYVFVTVRGKTRKVFVESQYNSEVNGYKARIRVPVTGSSIRGVLRSTSTGFRFYPSNRQSLDSL